MPPGNKVDLGTFLGAQGNSRALPKGPAERAPDEDTSFRRHNRDDDRGRRDDGDRWAGGGGGGYDRGGGGGGYDRGGGGFDRGGGGGFAMRVDLQ